MERHVPELHGWVKQKPGDDPALRCAILDVVSWFPGSCGNSGSISVCGARMWNVTMTVRRSQGWLQAAGQGECKAISYGRLCGESTKLLRDLVTTAAANHVLASTWVEELCDGAAGRPTSASHLRQAE